MKTHIRSTLLAAAALAVPATAHAQDAQADCTGSADCAPARSDIVVTATRQPTPVSQVGQSVSVVTRADIEREQAVTVTDALERLPGIEVARSGGFGQPASVFVRGADNAQSLVLIDGVRINDPADVGGGFDFGALAIGQFDRIEVVRGSQSVLWGSRAIGGVVNLITPEPTADWHARAEAEYGWRDQRRAAVSASGGFGPLGLSLGGQWLKGDGYSAYDENLGATERDGFESKSANARARLDIGSGLGADAGLFWTRATYGYDGYYADAANTGLKRDLTAFGALHYASADERLTARVDYGLTRSHRISDDATYGPYETFGRNGRVEAQVAWTPLNMVTLLAGYEHERSRFTDNYGSLGRASIDSGFGLVTLRPLEGLTLTGGLRYDDTDSFGHRTTTSASAAWALGGEDGPVLRASFGQGFKAPSLYQLYTNAGFRALAPETANSFDAGIDQPFAGGHGHFTVTAFRRDTRNLIDYDFVNWNYFNVGRVRAQGIELGMQVRDWKGFDVSLAYTYLDAKNRDTGLQLARRTPNSFSGAIDYRWAFGLSTGFDLEHGGARWDDAANTVPVGEHTTLGLRASLPVGPVELFGRIENLFDQHYEVVYGYGTPGRSAYAGVRLRM